MSIDDLAREAAADARRQAVQRVDTGSMLGQLHRMRRTRNIASVVSVLGLVAVLLLGGGLLARQYDTTGSGLTPGAKPAPSLSTPSSLPGDGCSDEVVTCLGSDRYRIALVTPITLTVPADFKPEFNAFEVSGVEIYRNDVDTAGVTIFEDPIPVRDDGMWRRDPAARMTAESQARWLADRPFLTHSRLVRTVVGGQSAWRVTGRLAPGAKLSASKNLKPTAPTFYEGALKAGYWPGLVAEYTLVDVPGWGGVAVIWSWALNEHSRVLRGNQALIDSMHFGP